MTESWLLAPVLHWIGVAGNRSVSAYPSIVIATQAPKCTPRARGAFAQNVCVFTGYDTGMYAALAFVLLAIAVWSQCACDWGTDECSSDDEAPEGMFS